MGVEAILVVVINVQLFKYRIFRSSQMNIKERKKVHELMNKSDQNSVVCNDVKFCFFFIFFLFFLIKCLRSQQNDIEQC